MPPQRYGMPERSCLRRTLRSQLSGLQTLRLLRLQRFVDYYFATLAGGDDLTHGSVSAEGDVDDVVAGIEHHVDGRGLIQHVLVNRDLSALGLGVTRERGPGRAGLCRRTDATSCRRQSSYCRHCQGLEGWREVEGLA
jgi:hypothetical protein